MSKRAKWWSLGVILATVIVAAGAVVASKRSADAAAKKGDRPPLELSQGDIGRCSRNGSRSSSPCPDRCRRCRRPMCAPFGRSQACWCEATTSRPGRRSPSSTRTARPARRADGDAESARTGDDRTDAPGQRAARQAELHFAECIDTADSAHQAQLAAVAAAKAALEITQLQMGDSVVKAPLTGTVAKRHVQPGEKVGFDAPLISIVDLAQLEVQTQAPVSDVPQIRTGMAARVEIEGMSGRTFDGRVERINPSTEPGTRTINLFVSLTNEGSLLKAGMFARVLLSITGETEMPALPLSAIRSDAGGPSYVWVLAEGKLARREVAVGRRDERAQLAEVRSGLSPGDQVIATKFDNLKDGLAARVIGAVVPARVADKDAPRAVHQPN
jgi:RND family efflux transporter MFP subunit